ncbi:hypothetical protein SLS53_002953 [Cytospora paraplurivora]|uniref:BTB domain-containing protein n=1 Tax=Cytospora paraplurivora TaxID=2898453 RepID=A0AAN9UC35_9PEZI
MSAQADQSDQGVPRPEIDLLEFGLEAYKLCSEPQDVVIIKVEGEAFKVHKALLVKDSKYFEEALNSRSLEAQTQTIDLEDVKKDDFALYVDVLNRSDSVKEDDFGSYVNALNRSDSVKKIDLSLYIDVINRSSSFKNLANSLSLLCKPVDEPCHRLRDAVHLWILSEKFQNSRLRAIAANGLDEVISWSTERGWKWLHEQPRSKIPSSTLNGWVFGFQEAFNDCQTCTLPFTEKIVQAAANMPPELFYELHDMLEPAFRSAVTKKFIRRFMEPKLEQPPHPRML